MDPTPGAERATSDPVHKSSADSGHARPVDVGNEMWQTRIDDYKLERLKADDAEEACLGGLVGGLMRFAALYEKAILEAVNGGGSILTNPNIQRGMQTYLGLMRQIDRYANLQARLFESEWRAITPPREELDDTTTNRPNKKK